MDVNNNNVKKENEKLKREITFLLRGDERFIPSVRGALKKRGFKYVRGSPLGNVVIPLDGKPETYDEYFELSRKYSFRLFLRDIIKSGGGDFPGDLTRFCSPRTAKRYLGFLERAGIIRRTGENCYKLVNPDIHSYGDTLEWYIAELFRREFDSPAEWRIHLQHLENGGDFDTVALVDGMLVYVEVKSSPPKHIHQPAVSEFFGRIGSLNPDMAVFFVDTHLRLRDKIIVMFKEEFRRRNSDPEIKTVFTGGYTINNSVFIINSKPDAVANFRTCLYHFFQSRKRVII